jgi:hypothetical protein
MLAVPQTWSVTKVAALWAALGSGAAALIANVASRAPNTITKGQAIREGDAAALQVAMTNLDGRALIFDDLERCPMKLEELFG